MRVFHTDIEGVLIVEPKVFKDDRGYFMESFNARDFDAALKEALGTAYEPIVFLQDNESKSHYGVLRGLHFQLPPYAQSKLVRCVKGKILDVVVDIRKGSPTFGKYVMFELAEDVYRQLFVPKGMAHGFAVLMRLYFNINVMSFIIQKLKVPSHGMILLLPFLGHLLLTK